MKKALGILAALAVLVCGMTGAMAEPFRVGICQLVTHDALDAATQGFMDALTEELGADNVTFDVQNAAGDSNTCSTIANSFVADSVDLIMANATPALQAASAATADIPILGTSVTEYGVALGIDDFTGTVGGNVSGTSDLAPLLLRRGQQPVSGGHREEVFGRKGRCLHSVSLCRFQRRSCGDPDGLRRVRCDLCAHG